MTRIIKGFAVDWGDRWRRTVWAQLEHIYWFNVSPDRQVEFDRSSSPVALNEGDVRQVVTGFYAYHAVPTNIWSLGTFRFRCWASCARE
jgi:hypothetical protein